MIGGYAGYTHFGQVSFFGVGAYVGALLMSTGWHWLRRRRRGRASGDRAGPAARRGHAAGSRARSSPSACSGSRACCEAFALGFDTSPAAAPASICTPVSDLKPLYSRLPLLALVMLLLTWRLDNSRFGLKLLAIREDEAAAEALGIRTTRLKIGTFIALGHRAGRDAARSTRPISAFIDPPTAFAPMMELTTIAMVLLGGMGTVLGPADRRDRAVGRERDCCGRAFRRSTLGLRRHRRASSACSSCRAASSSLLVRSEAGSRPAVAHSGASRPVAERRP